MSSNQSRQPSQSAGSSKLYSRRLILTDIAAVSIALFVSYLIMFDDITLNFGAGQGVGLLRLDLNPAGRTWVMGAIWMILLSANRSRDHRIVGHDNEEYKRVFGSGVAVLVTLALFALFFKLDASRLFVGLAISMGTFLLLVSRWSWRQWLQRQRVRGNYRSAVALAGPADIVGELLEQLRRDKSSTFRPTLLVAPNEKEATALGQFGLPVITDLGDPSAVLEAQKIDALILAGSEFLTKKRFKAIAWNLEASAIDLLVAPGLLDASRPRLHTRQVSGVSFLEVESPKFVGAQYFAKTSFDFVFSLIALVITLPITLTVALMIVIEDRGPVFFRQVRIGINGKPFQIWKFRSMYVGAEKKFDELRAQGGYETNSVQFKLKDDPRITRVGRVIRKLSIDEIPQFLNVVFGNMSVVGPRPHVQAEIDMYENHVHRRLLVKPGITGPWQVGGRSKLSWEESVALDLDYVENWSLVGDLLLIGKTLGALKGDPSAF